MSNTTPDAPTIALTVHEAAERLRVSPRTVWAWISQGRLDAIKLGPRTTRIPERSLERFVRRCAGSTPGR